MKILILGGRGMIGSMLFAYLHEKTDYQLYYTTRQFIQDQRALQLDVKDQARLHYLLQRLRPTVVINCIGLTPYSPSWNIHDAIFLNALFPQQLVNWADHFPFRLIHLSTAEVFAGDRGDYDEHDVPDGSTLYAKTKSLGEFLHPLHLVIRTSLLGPELPQKNQGLFSWFLGQTGLVYGYKHVVGNGVTTLELAKLIAWLLPKKLGGIIHFGGRRKISHLEQLERLQAVFQLQHIRLERLNQPQADLTLISTRSDLHYYVTPYETMFQELANWLKTRREEGQDG